MQVIEMSGVLGDEKAFAKGMGASPTKSCSVLADPRTIWH